MEHIETISPAVSVIMPTHNRLESLRRTLLALTEQDYPGERFEVIVVAGGCTDGTDDVVPVAVPTHHRGIAKGP